MSKLCVIFTGLAALVPPVPEDPSAARVLLRKVPPNTKVNGVDILPHRAVLRFWTGPGDAGIHDQDLQGETVTFTPAAAAGPTLQQPEQFVAVGPGLSQALPAKSAFRTGASNGAILSGQIVLTGGVISPLELDDILDLNQVSRTITAELRGAQVVGGAEVPLQAPRPVANGFLYERVLGAGETPAIQIAGGAAVNLAPTAPADLGFLAAKPAEPGDVYVVWVVNTASLANGTVPPQGKAHQKRAGGPRPAAGEAGGAAPAAPGAANQAQFDPDFDLLYDFVDGGKQKLGVQRLVPVIFVDPTGPPGEPPGRCGPGRTA